MTLSLFRPIRVLHRHWKLAAIAVFSLSIAMTLGILSLSITNTFFLLAPSGADPGRLVMVHSRTPGEAIGQVSYPDYQYYRENNHVFTDIAAAPVSIGVATNFDKNREIKIVSRPVSENYFDVLGIRPYLGRFFSAGDDRNKTPIAVMTYACWQRLGADPNIVGKTVIRSTIIGVAPKEFTGSFYGLNGDLLTPLGSEEGDSSWFAKRDARRLVLVARLKPGVTKQTAQVEMANLSAQLAAAYPKEDKDVATVVARATMLPPDAIPDAEIALAILMLVVVLLLLIASANVANLLLAIAVGRRQEAAIKLALGAQRGRLIREFLKESVIISTVSAASGYWIASTLIARYSTISFDLPMVGSYSIGLDLRLDATVVALTAALMLVAILATGLAPALYASAPNLAQMIGGEIVVGGTRKNRRRNILVVAQISVSTLVLVGMGLCERSLYNLRRVDPGFSARNILAMTVFPQGELTTAQAGPLQERLRAAVSAVPGVESVAFAKDLPLTFGFSSVEVQLGDSGGKIPVSETVVDSSYFDTLGVSLLSGRAFNSADSETSPAVAVINRRLAEMVWQGQNPLGESFVTGTPPHKVTVVGVTADGKYDSLDEAVRPVMYSALSQQPKISITLIARTSGDPRMWVEPVTQAMRGVGQFVPFQPVTFADLMNYNLFAQRIIATTVSGLSALGLLFAILGLFGAVSYSVSERKHELGIRVALGARRSELMKMILRQTLRVTGLGVAIGIGLGVAATVLLRSQFYGVQAIEWTVVVPVSALMLTISLLVAWVSARPWIAVDPMEALRHV